MILNYLGSKARSIPVLNKVIEPVLREARKMNGGMPIVFGDLFSGTGFISNYYKDHENVSHVVASDLELYSYVLNKALLTTVCNDKLLRLIAYFNSDELRPVKGLIWRHFSPAGGRLFYTEDNAARIDAIRITISRLYKEKCLTYKEVLFLLASLLMSVSRIANTASCFRAYLKKFCPRAHKRIQIIPVHKNTTRLCKPHMSIKNDAVKVAEKTKIHVAYIDPPYSANHYGGYYSFYNYLLVYHPRFQITGTAGVTKVYNKSAFGLKASSRGEMSKLVSHLVAQGCTYIVMSYNSDGILNKRDIWAALKVHGEVTLYKSVNKKYRPSARVKNSHVVEYIFVSARCVGGGSAQRLKEVWISEKGGSI